MRKAATKERPAPGAVEVRIVDADGGPLIEIEFYPKTGQPLGVRLRPEGAFVVAGRIAEALDRLGFLEEDGLMGGRPN